MSMLPRLGSRACAGRSDDHGEASDDARCSDGHEDWSDGERRCSDDHGEYSDDPRRCSVGDAEP
eukprot:354096-Chlamydomonas_euryale.AAC.1